MLKNTLKSKKIFKGEGKKSGEEEHNGGVSNAFVCLNTSGPKGEVMLINSTLDHIPKS